MDDIESPSRAGAFRAVSESDDAVGPSRSRAACAAWGAAGLIAFSLGAAGAVLPLIPTTPFILLAAFCFARSSRRLDAWFKRSRLYRVVFDSYMGRRAMTPAAKAKILVPVTLVLCVSFILMDGILAGRIAVALVLVAHYVFFCFFVETERKGC